MEGCVRSGGWRRVGGREGVRRVGGGGCEEG